MESPGIIETHSWLAAFLQLLLALAVGAAVSGAAGVLDVKGRQPQPYPRNSLPAWRRPGLHFDREAGEARQGRGGKAPAHRTPTGRQPFAARAALRQRWQTGRV